MSSRTGWTDSMKWERDGNETLDVYARPFIPNSLRAVNETPADVVQCTPTRRIDCLEYVRSFAGSEFLQADPSPPPAPPTDGFAAITNDALEPETYHSWWRSALIQEARALRGQCEEHALFRVPIVSAAPRDSRPCMFVLHVPGLRELTLRVEVGDVVLLRQLRFDYAGNAISTHGAYDALGVPLLDLPVQYQSIIWVIDRLRETLSLRIDHLLPGTMLFNVSFTVQQARLGALYRSLLSTQRALSSNGWMRSILFPRQSDATLQTTLNKRISDLVLRDALLNYEQIRAVNTILREDYGRVPYIISGPPGTGKTKTIVELALQLIDAKQSSHLLICAPSDPASDTLVQRLSKHLQPRQLFRLNAPSRSFPEVPTNVLPFCFVDQDMFSLPPFQQMMKYRIVVCTCQDAEILLRARLANADLHVLERGVLSALHPEQPSTNPVLHWTALLIDEAAQATEPEVLIPLSVIAPPEERESSGLSRPKVVMAGDQNQLGPRTASKTSAMQTSLFERLLDRPLYREHPLARSQHTHGVIRPLTQGMLPIARPPFTTLIRNYRSHPAVLATPSALFYFDTLEPEASQTGSLLSWQGWKGRQWPVLFVRNAGLDDVEHDGGGWFNVNEAKIALRYMQSFLQAGLVQPQEVCVMSPFRAQVRLLRKTARDTNLPDVNIGPLEAFQGLESKLVILCTTRTRNRFLEQDLTKGLGVILEPRRFNVALTRAKEGLIVIGNPDVLQQDVHWAAFLSFCHRNGLWEGQKYTLWEKDSIDSSAVSRLERRLLQQDAAKDQGSAPINGVRHFGVNGNEDDLLWESALDAEAVLQAREYEESTTDA